MQATTCGCYTARLVGNTPKAAMPQVQGNFFLLFGLIFKQLVQRCIRTHTPLFVYAGGKILK
jgi:hypothetical protein